MQNWATLLIWATSLVALAYTRGWFRSGRIDLQKMHRDVLRAFETLLRLAQRSTETMPREDADRLAKRVALTVFLFGSLAILVPALLHVGDVFAEDPFEPRKTTKTVVTQTGTETEKTETTTAEADESLLERSLAAGGLLLFRVGIVALAAFLAGAVVQRTVLGNFAIKVGGVEVPELAAETLDSAKRELKNVKEQRDVAMRELREVAEQRDQLLDLSQELLRRVNSKGV